MQGIRLLVIFAALIRASFVTAAPPIVTPGLWEVTIRTETPFLMPPTTSQFCISPDAAERPEPPKGKPTDDCKVVSGGGVSGNVLAYVTKCSKREVSSRFTYSGDRYEGVVEIKDEDRTIRQVHTARRIGDCPEEQARRKQP